MSWEYDFASKLKEMNNKPTPPTKGAMIGVTVSVNPFQVQIQNGKFLLDKSNAYVCKQLRERKSKVKLNATSGTMNGSSWSEFSISNGNIELDTVWKAGDKVLVVPDALGQKFFIVDILEVE